MVLNMQAKSEYINWTLLVAFVLSTGLFIAWQARNDLRMINESAAMVFLCMSLPAKIYKLRIVQYILFFVLVIFLFNAIRFSYTVVEGSVSRTYHYSQFNGVINPIVFVILIVYSVVNIDALNHLYQIIIKGSETEQKDTENKKIEFYYNQFNSCSDEELTNIFKIYNDYPNEAKAALKRIKSEKGIG
jgi:hypothetical protein